MPRATPCLAPSRWHPPDRTAAGATVANRLSHLSHFVAAFQAKCVGVVQLDVKLCQMALIQEHKNQSKRGRAGRRVSESREQLVSTGRLPESGLLEVIGTVYGYYKSKCLTRLPLFDCSMSLKLRTPDARATLPPPPSNPPSLWFHK